tara:strand:- start:519 stop:851 length:333 start_codon:yes stop_codon:yes gene_type:complete
MSVKKNKWTDEEKQQEILERNFKSLTRHLPTWATEKNKSVVKKILEEEKVMRKLPKEKFVIHCKETKWYMVQIEADNYDQAVKQWETIAKRRDYTTLNVHMETQSVSQEV